MITFGDNPVGEDVDVSLRRATRSDDGGDTGGEDEVDDVGVLPDRHGLPVEIQNVVGDEPD